MGYQLIENYGLIGNMRTAALVGMDGSIDWYCTPHFDSPSVFGALLDDRRGGRFRIHPEASRVRCKQLYWPGTNILVTRFYTPDGISEIEDFMAVGLPADSIEYHFLFRRVRCVRGSVHFNLECTPAFDYGKRPHRARLVPDGALFEADGWRMALSGKVGLRVIPESQGVRAEFTLNEGQSQVFVFKPVLDGQNTDCGIPPNPREADSLFASTVEYWRKWLSGCTYRGRWREQVQRSALILKLLTFEPTGAIVAAPTCGLPEVVGGVRNWDYRYTWLRDAAFTVYGFLRIGFTQEAKAFLRWMNDYAGPHLRADHPLPVLLRVNGNPCPEELVLSHWEGYRGSAPVRIGNGAAGQFQNDIPGELMDAIYLSNKYVESVSYGFWVQIRERVNWVCANWGLPDEGIWEVRGGAQHFTYSKVMNWVAIDRALRLAEKRSLPANRDLWLRTRDEIYEAIQSQGWNPKRGAFVQAFGSERLDASLLIMPLVFFMAPHDPRILSTLDRILEPPSRGGLVRDGMVYRYTDGSSIDGLPGEEGSFNMCSFWLVEALTRAGATDPPRLEQARLLFERILGFANHLGLYSEQIGPEGEALGNFPQAFTHLALISAAFNLDRALGNRG